MQEVTAFPLHESNAGVLSLRNDPVEDIASMSTGDKRDDKWQIRVILDPML